MRPRSVKCFANCNKQFAVTLTTTSMQEKPKVFITRRVPKGGVDLLHQNNCDVSQWVNDDDISREELLSCVKGVHAIFCLLTEKIDGKLLDAAGEQLNVCEIVLLLFIFLSTISPETM